MDGAFVTAQKRTNLHNFFEANFILSALWWCGLAPDRQMHEKRSKCRAQVTGEQPTRRGREGMPLNAMVWPFMPSAGPVSLPGVRGVDCSLRLPEWRSCTLSQVC